MTSLTNASKANSFLAKATLLMTSSLTVMAGATIAPSLPAMKEYFITVPNVDYWVRLVLTAPALFIAIGAPIAGIIIDQFGRKPLLGLAVFLYGLAGGSGLVLDEIGLILLGRVLLGFSVAGIMTTATTLIADYYTGAARAQFLGLQSAFMGLGGVLFLSVGGVLADVNWRMPFLIYLVAWVIVPFIVMALPEPNRERASTHLANEPVPEAFPWNLLILTYGIALLTQVVFYLIPVQIPFYLRDLINANASRSGLAIALSTLAAAISALSYPRIKARLSFLRIYATAFLLMAVGYGVISIAQSYETALLGLAIAGLGLGLLTPNMNVCLTSTVPGASRGRVLGGLTTAFFLGQFLSPIVSQPLSQLVGLDVTYRLAAGLMLGMTIVTIAVIARWK